MKRTNANLALDREFWATVLVEAAYTSDDEAAEKFGKSKRSIVRWRQRLSTDSTMAAIVKARQRQRTKEWAEQMPQTMTNAQTAMRAIFKEIRDNPAARRNPAMLRELVVGFKDVAEVFLTNKVIEAQLNLPETAVGEDATDGVEGSYYPN